MKIGKLSQQSNLQDVFHVELTREELMVIGLISASIGGPPTGVRGVVDGIFRTINENIGFYADTAKILKCKSTGSIYLDKIVLPPDEDC